MPNLPPNIDYTAELSAFEWTRPDWKTNKLIAASPFRHDNTPSFFVDLETGGWHDSGGYDAEYTSGYFVKLLAFLRDEPECDTEAYLNEVYGYSTETLTPLDTRRLRTQKTNVILPESIVKPLAGAGSTYVNDRGIHPKVAALNGLGYDNNAVLLPWRDASGRLANVKYRSLHSKVFWYAKGGRSLRGLVYGAHLAMKRPIKRAVLCEAEFDALTWQSAGVFAMAVGGVNFTEAQADIVVRTGIEEIICGGDNDKAGAKLNVEIVRRLSGRVRLYDVDYGQFKDANDAGITYLRQMTPVPTSNFPSY